MDTACHRSAVVHAHNRSLDERAHRRFLMGAPASSVAGLIKSLESEFALKPGIQLGGRVGSDENGG